MPLITWDESMSVNINEIDSQHQEFVKILNNLFDAMKVAKGSDVLEDVITKLIDYTRYHFTAEENFFDTFGYTDSALHKKEHRYFFEQINTFKKALKEGKTLRYTNDTPLSVNVWKLLKHWLINHIMEFDKKYAPLFREKWDNE